MTRATYLWTFHFIFRLPEAEALAFLPPGLEPLLHEGWGFINVGIGEYEALRPASRPLKLGRHGHAAAVRLYARQPGISEVGLYGIRAICDDARSLRHTLQLSSAPTEEEGFEVFDDMHGTVQIRIDAEETPTLLTLDTRGEADSHRRLAVSRPFRSGDSAQAPDAAVRPRRRGRNPGDDPGAERREAGAPPCSRLKIRMGTLRWKNLPAGALLRCRASRLPLAHRVRARALIERRRRISSGLILLGLAERFIGEGWWLTTLLTYVPQCVFLIPGLLLLPFALGKRRRRALAWLGGALLVYLLLDGWHLSLPAAPRTSPETSIVLLTYNIESGTQGVDGLAAAIRSVSPDVVCLQEASAAFTLRDPMPRLQRLLPEWHFALYADTAIGVRGGTIDSQEALRFPVPGSFRAAQLVKVTLKGRHITLATTHLATAMHGETLTRNRRGMPTYLERTAAVRRIQLDALLARTDTVRGPLILCGDFNTPPRGVEYARLTGRFTDAFAAVGNGFGWSFSTVHPLLRIDYVWCGKGVRPVEARILDWKHSDHRPVLATLGIADGG